MANRESMDRPLSPTPGSGERRVWSERNKPYGNLELWTDRVGGSPIVLLALNDSSDKIVLVANGADGSGSAIKRNASGYPVVDQGGVELNGPAVN